jgi:methanethiol S-methyltransferase
LFSAFALHHSALARPSMQARLARVVPDDLIRAVYVWTASVLLLAVCVLWRPVGGLVYQAPQPAALALYVVIGVGALLIVRAVRAIDPLELAGIRPPSRRDRLQVTGPYHFVRHPLYLGWMLIVFGAAKLTGDRLAFAAISSAYLVIAIPWEERSLEGAFGESYRQYKARVRWRVVPFIY